MKKEIKFYIFSAIILALSFWFAYYTQPQDNQIIEVIKDYAAHMSALPLVLLFAWLGFKIRRHKVGMWVAALLWAIPLYYGLYYKFNTSTCFLCFEEAFYIGGSSIIATLFTLITLPIIYKHFVTYRNTTLSRNVKFRFIIFLIIIVASAFWIGNV